MQETIYQATLDTLNALSIAFGCVKINKQNGEIKIMETKNGVVETHYDNGKLWTRANYKDGNLDGLFEYWSEDGQLWSRENYKDGAVVK